MMRRSQLFLQRYRREEKGGAYVIEFVFMFPLVLILFLMSVEMGIYSMRHLFLDRGLDMTVRYVRLNTDKQITHNDLKDMICESAGFLPECEDTLRLEMQPVDPRAFAAFNPNPDCVDISRPVSPERGFSLGQEHQMMILRACYRFVPVFGSTGLGFAFEKDGSGRARMVSSALFVQEPG